MVSATTGERHYDIRLTVRPLYLSTVLVCTTWYSGSCTQSRHRPPHEPPIGEKGEGVTHGGEMDPYGSERPYVKEESHHERAR